MEKQVENLQQQLRMQEKLASLGMLSAGIAHEIQNPLNFVINFSKMSNKLLDDLTDILDDNRDNIAADDRDELDDILTDLNENLSKIVEHGERAISIIQGILLVSRGKDGSFLPTDINKIVHEYVWLSYHAMRASHKDFNITVSEHYDDTLPQVMVIPQDISRAVLNLMNNACYTVWARSQKEGSDYTPTISIETTAHDDHFTITIADNGEGMDDTVKQRIFENFFTTKPIGQGTGLGLAITRDIVEKQHQGQLTFDSHPRQGTTFRMTIPMTKA